MATRSKARKASGGAGTGVAVGSSYWKRTREPIYSLVFILPFLAIYEAGILSLGAQAGVQVRNGADVLLRHFFLLFGVGGFYASGLFIVVTLFLWQFLSGSRWQVDARYLGLMFLESIVYATGLTCLVFLWRHLPLAVNLPAGFLSTYARVILSIGAGAYEEFVFRLILITVLGTVFNELAGLKRGWGTSLAVVVGAAIFSLAHHIGPFGEVLLAGPFLFRWAAGIIFGLIYLKRGFSVAAGSHAFYDIMVWALG